MQIKALKRCIANTQFQRVPLRITIVLLLCFWMSFTAMHPYYIGVTEVNFQTKSHRAEVSCKLFLDDVQDAIFRSTGTQVNLTQQNPSNKLLLEKFIAQGLKLQVGNRYVNTKFLGWTIEEEGIWCYLEATQLPNAKSITVCNQLLYNQLPTQTHFVHCTRNTTKKSWKLTNPDACHTFSF